MSRLSAALSNDAYKYGHVEQYPANTTMVYSNMTPRSNKHFRAGPGYDGKVTWFGLQGTLKTYLIDFWNQTFFQRPKGPLMDHIKKRLDNAIAPGAQIVDKFAQLHDLGHLPILIKALPEGLRVPVKVPFYTIRNTMSEYAWLTNFLETPLSAEVWKPVTSASIAHEYHRIFLEAALKTGAPPEFVWWQGHDFSMRGMSNMLDAASSGAGHLTSFFGTDTMGALDYLDEHYSGEEMFLGGSVFATEHSVMCMGTKEGELETFKRLITETYPEGIVSIVSDTWDLWNVVDPNGGILAQLKEEVLNRKPNAIGLAKVVIRPDSTPTTPADIICGDPTAPEGSPARKGVTQCLWETFGGTETSTGHKYLHERVGHIYGDSITPLMAEEIMARLAEKGFAAQGVLGLGSFTYQFQTRDTFGQAVKATFGVVDGENREIFKDPITDKGGMKKSAKGLLRVDYDEKGELKLFDQQTWEQEATGLLEPVFANGNIVRHQTIADIRKALWG